MNYLESVNPSHFPPLMETLLSGRAICAYRYPQLHSFLEEEEGPERLAAEAVLESMGRHLGHAEGVYFAVFSDYDDTVHEKVDALFSRYLGEARLIAEFFELLRQTQRGGEITEPGESFSFGATLERITVHQPSTDKLFEIKSMVSRAGSESAHDALKRVLDDLVKREYLFVSSSRGERYVITGEIVLFRRWRDFVADQEGVDLEGEADPEADDDRQDALL